jgi:peroxiredoxin
MRTLLFAFLVLVFVLPAAAQRSLRVGSPAPEFASPSMDGSYYDLDSMHGRVIVLTFWSTKCEICRNEIPKLNDLPARYDDDKVAFLALTLENEERVASYLKSRPFKFHIITDSFGVVLKYADRDKQGNIDMGFPAYFLIDQTGNVAYRSSGWDKTEEIAARIDKMLASR